MSQQSENSKRMKFQPQAYVRVFSTSVICFHLASCAFLFPSVDNGLVAITPIDHCIQMNKSYGPRQSRSCERKDVYDFLIAGRRWTFEKRGYQERLRVRVGEWLLTQGIPLEQIRQAKLEVWLGTHVFAPELPLLRVQIVAAGGNLLIEFPFNPDAWDEAINSVYILAKGLYPEYMGIKAGVLLVELMPGAKARKFVETIAKVDGLKLLDGSEELNTFYVSTPMLRESWTRANLLKVAQGGGELKQVYFIPAGEVAGEFAKVFEFSLVPQKNI